MENVARKRTKREDNLSILRDLPADIQVCCMDFLTIQEKCSIKGVSTLFRIRATCALRRVHERVILSLPKCDDNTTVEEMNAKKVVRIQTVSKACPRIKHFFFRDIFHLEQPRPIEFTFGKAPAKLKPFYRIPARCVQSLAGAQHLANLDIYLESLTRLSRDSLSDVFASLTNLRRITVRGGKLEDADFIKWIAPVFNTVPEVNMRLNNYLFMKDHPLRQALQELTTIRSLEFEWEFYSFNTGDIEPHSPRSCFETKRPADLVVPLPGALNSVRFTIYLCGLEEDPWKSRLESLGASVKKRLPFWTGGIVVSTEGGFLGQDRKKLDVLLCDRR